MATHPDQVVLTPAADAGPGPRAFHVSARWVVGSVLLLAYALVFGELFVRLLAPVPIIPRYVTGAPYGVRVGMPNMDFEQTTAESRAHIHTNSRGIRADQDFTYAKPTGTCRVLLFGDSFFVGFEVDYQDSFAYLLQKRIEAAGDHCQVINLAVSGFGTAEMLIALREEGLRYQPDVVVFSSNASDLDDNVRSSLYGLTKDGKLKTLNRTFLPGVAIGDRLAAFSVYRWIVENSQLYSAVRERLAAQIKALLFRSNKSAVGAGTDDRNRYVPETNPARDAYPSRLNFALLEEAKRVTEEHHAKFAVLEVPQDKSRTQFERMLPDYDPPMAQALHVVSPLDAFRSAANPDTEIYYEKGHGHLTPLGNRLLTDVLFDDLQQTGWLHASDTR